jgi:hypothetical protein
MEQLPEVRQVEATATVGTAVTLGETYLPVGTTAHKQGRVAGETTASDGRCAAW